MSAAVVNTWADVATVWAKAWTVSSSEGTAGMQQTMIRVQKFCIRYRSVLRPSWRLLWRGRYFAITGNDPDERREFIYLTCKEVAA
jgi:SPP1 family predicted phage head-tail adaptor